jgi:hypothetical protein
MSSVNNDSSSSNVLNDYDPAILSRYIHYYKTGRDINVDKQLSEEKSTINISTTTTAGATNTTAAAITGGGANNKPKKQKTKHVTPAILELRRSIQLCCRDNTLHTALHTFHKALCDLIHIEPQTFYQLLNLCEGTFTQRVGVVHVGTPRFSPNNLNHKKNNTTKMNSNLTTKANTTADNHSTAAQDNTNITNGGGGLSSSSIAAELGNDETTTMTPTTTIKQLTLKQRLYHANVIYQLMSSLNIPLIEQAYTALIRLASRLCDFDTAIQYLNEAEKTPQCKGKLRMYSTLLRAYCGEFDNHDDNDTNNVDDGDCMTTTTTGVNVARQQPPLSLIEQKRLIQALTLWKRMYDNSGGWSTGHSNYCIAGAKAKAKEGVVSDGNSGMDGTITTPLFGEGVIPKITLSECEYCAIMKLATIVNDYSVMERIISDVADTILIPGLKTTEIILQWFRCQSSNNNLSNTIISTTELDGASSALHHVTLPPRDDPCLIGSVTSAHGWNIYVNCTIDVNTGKLLLGPRECNTTSNNESSNAHTITTTIADDTNKSKNYQYRLKPVGLTSKSWTTMREMNKKIVLEGQVEGHVSQYQGGGKGKKRSHGSDGSSIISHNNQRHANSSTNKSNNNNDNIHSKSWRTNAWDQFETFIQQHPPYNIVIDGANVGYYEQNFVPITNNARSRHVDYKQIDWLVRHLLEKQPQQETTKEEEHQQQQPYIILFLHERHFSNKLCPDWAYPIIQSWDSNQVPYNRLTVYRTPTGMNDDWFWMHAALIHGGGDSSSGGGGDGVEKTTSSYQQSILAITNDEMRDHHFQMLAEGSFLRWKERHQVHFDFGSWNKELQRRDVLLQYPSSYSRRIQRVERDHDDDDGDGTSDAFVIPLPKKGDERRFADGLHVAEDGVPDEEMYIVIQRVSRCKTQM